MSFCTRVICHCLYLAFAIVLSMPLLADEKNEKAGAPSQWQQAGDWQTIRGEKVIVHFREKHKDIASKVVGIYNKYMVIMSQVFKHDLREFHLIILDNTDSSNGYSTFIPHNINGVFLVPPTESPLLDQQSWLELLVRHEATHLYHFDSVKGIPGNLQKVFGRNLLLFPSLFMPNWVIEGVATYQETDQQQGVGRGSNGYFDAIMRLETGKGLRGIHNATYNPDAVPSGLSYYYGYYFFEYLHKSYSPEKIYQFLNDYNSNVIPYRIFSSTRRHFDTPLKNLWNRYRNYLRKKFGEQIRLINKKGVVEGNYITPISEDKTRPKIANGRKLYYLYTNPYTGENQIRRQSLPEQGKGAISGGANLKDYEVVLSSEAPVKDYDIHPSGGVAYSKLSLCDQPGDWREAMYYSLYIQPPQKKAQEIFDCSRYQKVRWHPNGHYIFALRYIQGLAQLHLLAADGKFIAEVYSGKENEIVGSFAVSKGGDTLAVSRQIPGEGWDIYLLNRITDDWQKITAEGIDVDPVFTEDGKNLVYVSNKGGVYNLWRYNLESKTGIGLSNVLSAAFEPAVVDDNTVVYSRLYSDGYAVHIMDIKEQDVVTLQTDDPIAQIPVNEDDYKPLNGKAEPYSIFTGFAPTAWYPYINADSDSTTLGAAITGFDILQTHSYQLLAYGQYWDDYKARNNYGYQLGYFYKDWLTIGAAQNDRLALRSQSSDGAVFATQSVYSAITNFAALKELEYQLKPFIGAQMTRDDYYTVDTDNSDNLQFIDKDLIIGVAGVDWFNLSSGSRSYVPAKGVAARFMVESSSKEFAGEDNLQGEIYQGYIAQYITLAPQYTLSYNLASGYAEQGKDAFSFGGINGSNIPAPGLRNFSLHGYATGEKSLHMRGYSYAKLSIHLPGGREGVGFLAPPIGVGARHFRVFGEYLQARHPTKVDYKEKDFYSLGAEARFQLILGYLYRIPMRFIIARGEGELGVTQAGLSTDFNF